MIEINGNNDDRFYVELRDEDVVIVDMSAYRAAYSLVRAGRDAVMACRAALLVMGMRDAANVVDPRRLTLPTRTAYLFLVDECNYSPKVARHVLRIIEDDLNKHHVVSLQYNHEQERTVYSQWVLDSSALDGWAQPVPTETIGIFTDVFTGEDYMNSDLFDPDDPKI